MAIEIRPSKEYLIKAGKQIEEFITAQKEKQDWIYYLLAGSFLSILFLNFLFPDFYWLKPRPSIEIKSGFLGLVLTFFGSIFFLRAFFTGIDGFYWVLSVILSILLLYFGIPLIFR